MYDVELILEKTDLVAMIESDLGPGKKSGRWMLFSCPFPGHAHGDRKPALAVTADNGRYHCFVCGKSGNAIDWLKEYRGMEFKQACEYLGGSPSVTSSPAPRRSRGPEMSQPPAGTWQARALEFIEECRQHLWGPEGEKALGYLRGRGLIDDAIEVYSLGYNPAEAYELPEAWGLEDDKKVWLPRGITIPAMIDPHVWYINIRRPTGEPKYVKVKGSRRALFGASNLVGRSRGMLTEGEFDAIIADQVLGRVVGVATLGSATNRLDLLRWGPYLMLLDSLYVAYDADQPGEEGAQALTDLGSKVKRIHLPEGSKDINDFTQKGGSLNQWFWQEALPDFAE